MEHHEQLQPAQKINSKDEGQHFGSQDLYSLHIGRKLVWISLVKIVKIISYCHFCRPIINCLYFSLFANLFGIIFGGYGVLFMVQRSFFSSLKEISLEGQDLPLSSISWLYVFIFHRFLMMGGDLLPSLDRAVALLFPLKFHCYGTPTIASGICKSASRLKNISEELS